MSEFRLMGSLCCSASLLFVWEPERAADPHTCCHSGVAGGEDGTASNNTKTIFPGMGISIIKIRQPSYLCYINPYTGKITTSFYWDDLQIAGWSPSSFKHSLTHCGQDKMAAISQTMLSNAFSGMKMLEFQLKFHWSLFLRVQLTTLQHLFR